MVTNGGNQARPQGHQIVMVEWLDAEGESGWSTVKECIEHEITPVTTIGWLICENNKWLVLASTFRDVADECSSIDFIPIGCVLRRRTLWHPETSKSWRDMWEKPFERPELL